MKLAQTTWLERHKGGGNLLCNGKVCRVNLVEGAAAAANLLGRVLQGAVHKRGVALCLWRDGAGDVFGGDGAVENVRACRGDVLEGGLWDAKVFGENVLGRVRDPVVEVERGSAWARRVSGRMGAWAEEGTDDDDVTRSCQSQSRQR